MGPGTDESAKGSRAAQGGAAGSNFRKRENSAVATSAMPIGMRGGPELACCTASIASARIALAMSRWLPGVTRLSCAEGDVATSIEKIHLVGKGKTALAADFERHHAAPPRRGQPACRAVLPVFDTAGRRARGNLAAGL